MVWKQDLAKLRQALKASEEPAPKALPPKPVAPKPAPPASMAEEDALFLQAMGHRRAAPKPPTAPEALSREAPAPEAIAPPEPPVDFSEAMASMKGLKRVGADTPIVEAPAALPKSPSPEPAPAEPPSPASEEEAPPAAAEPVPAEPPPLEAPKAGPVRIQLAAGMAIEVDGGLDLRGHTRVDALERLAERIQDGVVLGWRTLHVHLGPSADLAEALQDYLASPKAQVIARYAQAPIPMGGAQAWILYYRIPPSA